MKKFFTILMVLAAALVFVSCQKESEPALTADSLIGTWHLVSIDGDAVGTKSFSDLEGLSVFIVFNADTFEIRQRAGENVAYDVYTGTWQLSGIVLSGKYSDGSAWASTYEVTIKGDTLTLTNSEEVQVFNRML